MVILMRKLITMIAGPNGAGKSTVASSLLDLGEYEEFLNADDIAKGLAPINPERVATEAGKLFSKRYKTLVETEQSFAFETTGAAVSFCNHLMKARKAGYELNLLFLWLPSADQAVQRVACRVKQKGHNIPEPVIRRRYSRGLVNLINLYLPIMDTAIVLDNSHNDPRLRRIIAEKKSQACFEVYETGVWHDIKGAANGKST